MIFSNKIKNLPTGSNINIYSIDNTTMDMHLFNDMVKKYQIKLDNQFRCLGTTNVYPYNQIITLDDDFLCLCLNSNFKIIKKDNLW